MVQLTDTLTFDQEARICADGSLVAEAFAARTGLQDYLGREIDPENKHGLRDKAVASVYRPESEVFKTDSLATYAAAPVTLDHPSDAVTADNWRTHGVGEINGDIARDGQRVRVPIIVRDANAVKAATSTHKQLSMGYATDLVFPTDGKHPDGTVCDAYQTNIRINHIALVRAARGGPELKISDERQPQPQEDRVKVTNLDGLTVNASDAQAAESAITTLDNKLTEVITARDKALADVATLTTEKTTLDAKVTTLEQQVKDAKLSPQQLRDAAKAYQLTVDKAKALGVTVNDEMDEPAIMKAVVSSKLGDAAKDWDDKQIAVSFATLTADVKASDIKVVSLTPQNTANDAAATRDFIRDMRYA